MKKWIILLIIVFALAAFGILSFRDIGISTYQNVNISTYQNTAGLFFKKSTSVEDLWEKYDLTEEDEEADRVKVLIVPGHDPDSGGAEFNEVYERDLNYDLSRELEWFFSLDSHFETILARDDKQYHPEFAEYFENGKEGISRFVEKSKRKMDKYAEVGLVRYTRGIPHGDANSDTALKLYGINKWSNENDIDFLINIHFNDYWRKNNLPGEYKGFSIYVPESQYSNSETSHALARAVFRHLDNYYPKSNLPLENKGIVPDQKLIAIGANNTLEPAVILIEYGYIYELQFREKGVRNLVLQTLARATYNGIIDFFLEKDTSNEAGELPFPLPSNVLLRRGARGKQVLSLQTALHFLGFYPPDGYSRYDCSLDGIYGPCTQKAVRAFQKKNNLLADGIAGRYTLSLLSETY